MTTISDTFNRADSAVTINPRSDGGTWLDANAIAGVLSNQAYLTGAGRAPITGGTDAIGVYADTGQVDQDFSFDNVRANTNGFSQLFFAFDKTHSVQSGYTMQYDSSGPCQFTRWNAGSSTLVGTLNATGWTAAGSTTLRVTFNHVTGAIDLFVAATHVGTLTDGSPITAATNSLVGFTASQNNASTGETWDNFTATATLPPPPAPRLHVIQGIAVARAANW